MKRSVAGMIAFGVCLLLIASPVQSQPPGGKDGKGGGKGAKGGFKLGTVIPSMVIDELKLTDDQKAKLQEIEQDVKSKLEKLLTDEQKKVIENSRPAGPGGAGGPGAKGGAGEKGGKGPPPPKGDKGGNPGPGAKGEEKPDRPPVEKAPAPSDKRGKPEEKGPPSPAPGVTAIKDDAAIQWYATLSRGLAEAERTGKPILFVSAAPHCAGVSGMW